MLNVEASMRALSELSANGFKLWFYLAKNQVQEWTLVRSAYQNLVGVANATYDKAFQELKDKGYLEQKNDSRILVFHESPKEKRDDRFFGF